MDPINAANIAASSITANAEGYSPDPYWDVNGYAIGYGNHYYSDGSTVESSDNPISQSDAFDLLVFYLTQNANAIASQLTVDISDTQLAALADIKYRCGTITNTLLNLINSGATADQVAAQIRLTCTTVNGQPSAIETTRAGLEADLYLSGGAGNYVLPLMGVVIGLLVLAFVVKE